MSKGSFFNKVISYLAEINKGKENLLVESGWLSPKEENKIIIILLKLGCIDKKGDNIIITKKGYKTLLLQKLGQLEDNNNENISMLLT
jgi:hypothetical protein